MWRKGQKSTLKKTSNDVLTISNLHVYLLFRGKRKENTRKRYYVDDSRPVLEWLTNWMHVGFFKVFIWKKKYQLLISKFLCIRPSPSSTRIQNFLGTNFRLRVTSIVCQNFAFNCLCMCSYSKMSSFGYIPKSNCFSTFMVKVFLYTILICIVCIVDIISYTIPLIHYIFVYVSNLNGGHRLIDRFG